MKPDTPRDARHGAQGRGARSGRATSRTDGAKPTGGNTARIGANVDGKGRTVAVLPDERTGEAHHGRHVWPRSGAARHFGSTSGGEIGSGAHPEQAERLRTFTGCRARTFALDEAGHATGRTARGVGTRRTGGTGNAPDGRHERHRAKTRHIRQGAGRERKNAVRVGNGRTKKSTEKGTWYIRGIVCHN